MELGGLVKTHRMAKFAYSPAMLTTNTIHSENVYFGEYSEAGRACVKSAAVGPTTAVSSEALLRRVDNLNTASRHEATNRSSVNGCRTPQAGSPLRMAWLV
jgi:hypothetical protein